MRDTKPPINVALKLAILSSANRLTQCDVARMTGIHESRLSRIIRGHLPANATEQRKIARVLRTPVEALFESSDDHEEVAP